MGEINLSSIPIDMILNILNIVLLFLLVRKFAYKPVRKFMDARTARVNAAAEEAAAKAAAADAVKAEYEEKLAACDTECAAKISEAQKQAKQQAQSVLDEARQQAGGILADAKAEAKKQRDDALKDMQGDIVDLAFGISEKLLERSVRDADTNKMADRLFDSRIEGENS